MKNMTAVQWLATKLKKNHGLQIDLYSEFEQAKQMEKNQINNALDYYLDISNIY